MTIIQKLILIFSFLLILPQTYAQSPAFAEHNEERIYLVTVDQNVSMDKVFLSQIRNVKGLEIVNVLEAINVLVVQIPKASDLRRVLARLKKFPRITSVERSLPVSIPNPPESTQPRSNVLITNRLEIDIKVFGMERNALAEYLRLQSIPFSNIENERSPNGYGIFRGSFSSVIPVLIKQLMGVAVSTEKVSFQMVKKTPSAQPAPAPLLYFFDAYQETPAQSLAQTEAALELVLRAGIIPQQFLTFKSPISVKGFVVDVASLPKEYLAILLHEMNSSYTNFRPMAYATINPPALNLSRIKDSLQRSSSTPESESRTIIVQLSGLDLPIDVILHQIESVPGVETLNHLKNIGIVSVRVQPGFDLNEVAQRLRALEVVASARIPKSQLEPIAPVRGTGAMKPLPPVRSPTPVLEDRVVLLTPSHTTISCQRYFAGK